MLQIVERASSLETPSFEQVSSNAQYLVTELNQFMDASLPHASELPAPSPKLVACPLQGFIKRGFYAVASILPLAILSPLVVFVFLLAKLASRQPVLCQVKYCDLNDETFEAFHFRCSSGTTDGNSGHATSSVGQFLYRSSFNELLLLINVLLRGDMSLVGRRPLPKLWAAAYRATICEVVAIILDIAVQPLQCGADPLCSLIDLGPS
jgi:lipopolysaccharide/colanic/teichoic acid biosynthesis glycosyltransferase